MAPDLATLRQQLQQLQALHQSQVLDDAAYRQAREPLERRIVELVMSGAADAAPGAPSVAVAVPRVLRVPRRLAAGVACGVLALAAAGYWWTGAPQLALQQAPAPMAGGDAPAGTASPAPHALGSDQIAAMVDKLRQRLEANPGDAEGWAMLARSYAVLGRHADALPAYRQAAALRGDDAALLADYADALAVTRRGALAGEPLALVQQALRIDPDQPKALSLAGTEAFDRKDYALAARHWERLAQVAPPDSRYAQQARDSLAEARELGRLPVPAAATSTTAPQVTDTAAVAAGAGVSGTVSLAPGLRAQAAPHDTVFVFARAAQGPRMPLAILRKQVKDLPFDFKLDDSMAMSPAMRLSAYPSVVVGARISKTGEATPQPGDLAGQTAAVTPGAGGLKVEISQVVGR